MSDNNPVHKKSRRSLRCPDAHLEYYVNGKPLAEIIEHNQQLSTELAQLKQDNDKLFDETEALKKQLFDEGFCNANHIRELNTELSQLRAERQWHDISTAPKDKDILLLMGVIPIVGSWDEQDEKWVTYNMYYENTVEKRIGKPFIPTHWQPIVLPLTQTKQSGGSGE